MPEQSGPAWAGAAGTAGIGSAGWHSDSTASLQAPTIDDGVLRRLRRQRHAETLHGLGARVLFEFVDEIARRHPDIADDINERLARYASLDPAALVVTGGDRFATAPIHVVGEKW
jgi:hypothetical protein